MSKCEYVNDYWDVDNRVQKFKCKEIIYQDNLCKFHHKDYLTDATKNDVEELFQNIVTESIHSGNPLLCVGFRLPSLKALKKIPHINFIINFDYSEFILEDLDIMDLTFNKYVSFNLVTINNTAKFDRTIFEDRVVFNRTKFKNAHFRGTKFKNYVNFTKSNFHSADFSYTEFANVNFFNSEFQHDAFFTESEFLLEADFSKAKFKKLADFTNTKFKNYVNFTKSKFHSADFRYAQFSNVHFINTEFKYNAFFTESEFLLEADFSKAKFKKLADFENIKFVNYVNFTKSKFHSADFRYAQFSNVHFINTEFKYNAFFTESEFLLEADFSKAKFKKLADFTNIKFNNDSYIIFNGNLSNVTFIDTDIKSVHFGTNVSWKLIDNLHNDHTQNTKKRNIDYKIYEDLQLEIKENTKQNLESIKNIYRDLRDNYDGNLQYDISGEFFIREMELNRKYYQKNDIIKKKHWLRRIFSIYGAYNLFALYGQSWSRPIYCGVVLMTIAGIVFYFDHDIVTNNICNKYSYSIISRALSILIPFNISSCSNLFDDFFKLAFLPISATFFIALKRKLERKLRH